MDLRSILDSQAGVVSHRQLHDGGIDDNDIRRLIRRRQLVRLHRGVFVTHTGPLPWIGRAWAAVLVHEPAALCDVSALNRAGEVIHVAIEHPRSGPRLTGVRLHRVVGLSDRVQWNASPPRLRIEEAVIDVASAAPTRARAVAVITDACQRRLTTPSRVAAALQTRRRVRDGVWLRQVVSEAADGALSVLEQAYLRKVERAHRLPRADRQVPTLAGRPGYRDVHYSRQGVVVELDGRLGHEFAHDRWSDMDRDLVAAVGSLLTIRLGWIHAEDRPCETAARLALVLRARGWRDHPFPCSACCPLPVELQALGA